MGTALWIAAALAAMGVLVFGDVHRGPERVPARE